ncbi:uncharacterized protein LOC142325769 [Lycorma delicatula]|uniref:uncharacterized protein LOC142325769 n=1 Tax=Lycorma delicatula TaxID=130591 RepID=UPI003F5169E8
MDTLKVATWNVRGLSYKEIELEKLFRDSKIKIAVVTETKKKLSDTKYVGDYFMLYSGVRQDQRASKGVAICVDNNWASIIKDYKFVSDKIITVRVKHARGYFSILCVYAPEDSTYNRKQEETDDFYVQLQDVVAVAV